MCRGLWLRPPWPLTDCCPTGHSRRRKLYSTSPSWRPLPLALCQPLRKRTPPRGSNSAQIWPRPAQHLGQWSGQALHPRYAQPTDEAGTSRLPVPHVNAKRAPKPRHHWNHSLTRHTVSVTPRHPLPEKNLVLSACSSSSPETQSPGDCPELCARHLRNRATACWLVWRVTAN
jgi:hypothetical protein